MGYRGFRMGGGLNTKAAVDAIPDNALSGPATGCGYDEVGTVTSARGRELANNDVIVPTTGQGSGSLLGGFDGLGGATLATQAKYRFLKRGSAVYTNTTTSTPLTDATNLTATYTTDVSTLVNPIRGLSAPTWSSTSMLSGFMYGGYAYLADGTATQRLSLATGAPPTVTANTWGLRSPGYIELTDATPLSCSNGTTTMTVTHAAGHGWGFGLAASPSYPYAMNMEVVGLKSIAGIPENEINCLHFGGAGGAGDITVTSSGGTLDSGATYSVTYQNGAGAYAWTAINFRGSEKGASFNLSGGSIGGSITTPGDDDPATNQVNSLVYTGTVTAGFFRLVFARSGTSGLSITADIAYNATAAQVQAAILELPIFNGGLSSAGAASVTATTTITFPTTTTTNTATLASPGGGSIGFIRQGPTLAVTANAGAIVGGTYYYAYCFYNGVAKSNMSAQVPVYVSSNGAVVLTNILLGPVGTTERWVFRTDVDGRQLYFVAKIENNTATTYTDTAMRSSGSDSFAQPGVQVDYAENPQGDSDKQAKQKKASKRAIREAEVAAKAAKDKQRQELSTNLGLLSDWVDHDPAPVGLKHVGLIGDTAFGIDGEGSLRFSKAGEVEHWPLSNSVKPPRGISDAVLSWAAFDRDCIFYTTNGLFRLSAVGLSFEDARLEEIESPVGLVGEWALAPLDGQMGHLFLAKSGLYLFDGARVTEVSYPIERMFTDSTYDYYIQPSTMSQAIMVTSRDRMYLAYRKATDAGVNNRILLGDFQDPSDPKFTVMAREYTSLWREKSDNYVLGGQSGGFLYVEDQGWTDNGGTIVWNVGTKSFRLNGQTMVQFDEVILDADFGTTASTSVYVYVESRPGTYHEETYTITDVSYPYRKRWKLKLPVHFKGDQIYVNVSSTHAGKRALYEVGFTSKAFQDEP